MGWDTLKKRLMPTCFQPWRQRSLRVVQRDEELLPRIQALKAEHPFWGYPRVWA
jgi:hypothetical protein